MVRPVRRVLTGHDAQGKSIIWKDGPTSQVMEPLPGLISYDLWETVAPAVNTGDVDTAVRDPRIEPHHAAGTIFRIVDFPPDTSLADIDMDAAFAEMGSADAHDASSDTAGMHETQTTDYAIVLAGEVWAVMETAETKLEAGDVLVQRGTNHAWSNRTDEVARVAFILIGAEPHS